MIGAALPPHGTPARRGRRMPRADPASCAARRGQEAALRVVLGLVARVKRRWAVASRRVYRWRRCPPAPRPGRHREGVHCRYADHGNHGGSARRIGISGAFVGAARFAPMARGAPAFARPTRRAPRRLPASWNCLRGLWRPVDVRGQPGAWVVRTRACGGA